ncbi:MAG: trypsin-like peptidase domain-containing protein [Myxococcales bacterium]|nr:trypsin-like peptidase domain-containing protein [Myxococcales bacterium]
MLHRLAPPLLLALALGACHSATTPASHAPQQAALRAPAPPPGELPAPEPSVADLEHAFERAAEAIAPAVVSVLVEQDARAELPPWMRPFGPEGEVQGLGSGVIIDEAGYILTNNHVVADARSVKVRLHDDRELHAEVVGTDPKTDLAVIKVRGDDLVAAPLHEGADLRVGQWVLAVGSPFGLTRTVTAGIVSAVGRGSMGITDYGDFIQTDAAINRGNSGGPLIDLRGRVVGINTAVGSGLRPGFAIPVDQAKRIVEQLRDHGEVTRGWLGAGNVPGDAKGGARIGSVYEGTPAERAGLRPGDLVEALDGDPVESFEALRAWVGTKQPGDEVELRVRRDGQEITLRATLGARPKDSSLEALRPSQGADGSSPSSPSSPPSPPSWLPFGRREDPPPPAERYADPPAEGLRLGVSARETARGLEVVEVREGSLAAELGLRPGDLLRELDGHVLHRPADVATALHGAGATIEVRFERDGTRHVVTLER